MWFIFSFMVSNVKMDMIAFLLHHHRHANYRHPLATHAATRTYMLLFLKCVKCAAEWKAALVRHKGIRQARHISRRILTVPFRWSRPKVTGRHRKHCRLCTDRMSGSGRWQAENDGSVIEQWDERKAEWEARKRGHMRQKDKRFARFSSFLP